MCACDACWVGCGVCRTEDYESWQEYEHNPEGRMILYYLKHALAEICFPVHDEAEADYIVKHCGNENVFVVYCEEAEYERKMPFDVFLAIS